MAKKPVEQFKKQCRFAPRQLTDELRPCPGTDGLYVSISGDVFSSIYSCKCTRAELLHQRNPSLDTRGYFKIGAMANHKQVTRMVHQLVLESWGFPRPSGMECRHLDGNKLNNHLSNLRWGTASENNHDKIAHGTATRGERHPRAKLTWKLVREIRQKFLSGDLKTGEVVAEKYGVSASTIWYLLRHKTWPEQIVA